MPQLTDVAVAAVENVAAAAVNYGVSVAIGPFVGPLGAALAPSTLGAAASTILTSATSSLVTIGIFASGKKLVGYTPTQGENDTEITLNEAWDDADVPLVVAP